MFRKLLLIAGLGLIGCTGQARVVAYSDPAPSLVYVQPGVAVIEDYDYPVFYSDNYYWMYNGGVWYRSTSYRGGWVTTYNVPVAVRRIDRPHAYVHYRGNVVRRGQPVHRGPVTRDHRHYRR